MVEVDREPSSVSLGAHAFARAYLRWRYKDGQLEVKAIRKAVLSDNPPDRAELLRLCDRIDDLIFHMRLARHALWREGFEGRVFYISIGAALGAVFSMALMVGR